jgi:predicted glycoside hydrolase/deacetylase ChbG (UPF0249 family)
MIVLNADDYALSAAVARAITALADASRLSAVSIMTNMPLWPASADAIAARRDGLALGLHLNLTEGRPLGDAARAAMTVTDGHFIPLRDLIARALLGRLTATIIADEVRAQLDAFTSALGHLPDFIDGHQHVHVLPAVRDGLLAVLGETTWPAPPLVRTPTNRTAGPRDPLSASPKRWVAGLLATGFRTRLARAGLPTNDTFAGFTTFRPGSIAAVELAGALRTGRDGLHLIMCHPAARATDPDETLPHDPLAARRLDEFHALMAIPDLPERIWHPTRDSNGAIDWSRLTSAAATRDRKNAKTNPSAELRSP